METTEEKEAGEEMAAHILEQFGWERSSGKDQNFPCENKNHPEYATTKEHPCDCSYHYIDPVSGQPKTFITNTKGTNSKSLRDKSYLLPYIRKLFRPRSPHTRGDEPRFPSTVSPSFLFS